MAVACQDWSYGHEFEHCWNSVRDVKSFLVQEFLKAPTKVILHV